MAVAEQQRGSSVEGMTIPDAEENVRERHDMGVVITIDRDYCVGAEDVDEADERVIGEDERFSRVVFRGKDRVGLLGDFVETFEKWGLEMIRVELKRELEGLMGREELGEFTKGSLLVRKIGGGLLKEEDVEGLKRELGEVWEMGVGKKRKLLELKSRLDDVEMTDYNEMEDRMLWDSEDAMLRVDTMHASMYMSLFMSCKNREGLLNEILRVVTAIGLDVRMAAFTTYNNEGKYRHDTMYFVDADGNMPSEAHRITLFHELYGLIVRF